MRPKFNALLESQSVEYPADSSDECNQPIASPTIIAGGCLEHEPEPRIAMAKKNESLLCLCSLTLIALFARGAEPEKLMVPPPNQILSQIRKEHPRLLASAGDFARLKERSASDEQLKAWRQKLHEQAERLLTEPPSRYEIPDGLRLLATSRRVLDRVYTLALLYRLDDDKRFAQRAWQELAAAADFPDWNPRHFLDTAEMTHAFAIAYDWLYDVWSPDQRASLRAAIVEKGLRPALGCYRGTANYPAFPKMRHNWNQVCSGGIGLGALAIADEIPELSGEILHDAIQSLQLPMSEFAPDGAWKEGPGYWNYATDYNVVFLAALESALGTDFGLAHLTGFADTGLFPIYLTGPLGRTVNYADGSDGTIRAPQMFWLARKFHRPEYARYQVQVAAPRALDLLWFDADARSPGSALPPDKYFRGAEVATFRSAWDERDAVFVGFKAGDNKANHSHLDLGSFVLDALGQRWAVDLGADDYNLPGYFGGQRWKYYRLRGEGHNTLVVNPGSDPDQDPGAAARIVRFESKPDRAFAIADLTRAHARYASQVKRGIALLDRRQVLVQDEFQAAQPRDVWWFMHTPASVQLNNDGTIATLSQANTRLQARLLSPAKARFTVMNAEPLPSSPHPDKQARNDPVRKLAIHLTDATEFRLAVLLVPLPEGEPGLTGDRKISALREW
jgi:hypothetical protein